MVTQKNNFHEFETYNIFLWIFKAYVENTEEVQKHEMEHCMATGIERSGVKRIRLHDLRHSHARNRRVFLPTGIKRWTESEKYGKISIRNDIVKSLRKESKVVQTKKQYGNFSLTALSFASISIFSG